MSPQKLRVACVGAGYFSQFHYGSWARMDRVELVGSCNRDITKARATGLPAFDDLTTMIAAVKPDLVDIILPPVAHAQTVRAALAAGIKWMICQKPFCNDLAEAEMITAEAEAAGAIIVIHENFRFQPWFRVIKAALDDGLIGQLQQFTFRLRPGDGQGEDAYLSRQPAFRTMDKLLIHETGVHYVDTFGFLMGAPTSVYAELRQINPVLVGEDAGIVLFHYPNGVRAVFDGNRHLDHAATNLRCTMGEALVEGTTGTIKLYGDGSVTLRQFGALEESTLSGPCTWDGFGGDCVHALQTHVVDAFFLGKPLENVACSYLSVVAIEEAIYASTRDGCRKSLE